LYAAGNPLRYTDPSGEYIESPLDIAFIMKILKDEDELNPSDLMDFPVWEFAFEESKAYLLSRILMKPCKDPSPYNIHESRYLIRTTFRLANGMEFSGHTKPFDLLDQFMGHLSPIDLEPVIVTTKGRVVFWYGINRPNPEETAENYRSLSFSNKLPG